MAFENTERQEYILLGDYEAIYDHTLSFLEGLGVLSPWKYPSEEGKWSKAEYDSRKFLIEIWQRTEISNDDPWELAGGPVNTKLFEIHVFFVAESRCRVVYQLYTESALDIAGQLHQSLCSLWESTKFPPTNDQYQKSTTSPDPPAPEPPSVDSASPIKTDTPNDPTDSAPVRRVTDRVRKRAELFRSIKEKYPELNQQAVAMKAMEVCDPRDRDVYSAETVRNAYRTMGWEWPRGERTR